MRKYESLVGRRYGKLVVLEQIPSNGSPHRRWLCRCDCGNLHEATTGNLNSGHATNCGCMKSPDLTGKVFGHITVLRRSPERRRRGDRQLVEWECQCECGAIVYRTSDQLSDTKERMCVSCARKNSAAIAQKSAGFEGGTQVTKIQNMKLSSANTSGCRGVYHHKKQKKWCARLKFQGKLMNFGSYDNFEDAVKARRRAEEEVYGTYLSSLVSNQ